MPEHALAQPLSEWPELVTPRLRMRWPEVEDIPQLHEAIMTEGVCEYFQRPGDDPFDNTERYYREYLLDHRNDGTGLYLLYETLAAPSVVLGILGLGHFDCQNGIAELGIWLRSDYWGHGYAAEACMSLIPNAMRVFGFARIEILVEPDNHRSLRLFESIGAHREGVLRRRLFRNQRQRDAVCFSFVDTDDIV